MHRWTEQSGFTLIELVVVITLTGIVAVLAGQNIVAPIQGFIDLGRRAALVDEADLALSRMSREVQLALPNSVATGHLRSRRRHFLFG